MAGSSGEGLLDFLGVPPDKALLAGDRENLPADERPPDEPPPSRPHDRLVHAGSALTAASLVGGAALVVYAAWRILSGHASAPAIALGVVGVLLVATHWGWVHVAEYVRLTLDAREDRRIEHSRQERLVSIAPYPRFSVTTNVLPDASLCVERILHRPVGTARGTFTFAREPVAERTFEPDASAAVIASEVERMRREARLDTDRVRAQWEAASSAYDAALFSADDERQRLAARHAAASALSEHINASLLEPPL